MPRKYEQSLTERIRRAANEKARYWRNPEARLRTINRARVAGGYAPRVSLDEVAPRRGGA